MISLSITCKTVFGVNRGAPTHNEPFRFRMTTDHNSTMSSALQFVKPEGGKITLKILLQAIRSVGDSMSVRFTAGAEDPDMFKTVKRARSKCLVQAAVGILGGEGDASVALLK
jgi:hypothetical protein